MDVDIFKLYMGNNSFEYALGVGEYHRYTSDWKQLVLHETFYSPDMRQNLLSIKCLVGEGFDIRFNKNRMSLRANNILFAWGSLANGLFVLDLDVSKNMF